MCLEDTMAILVQCARRIENAIQTHMLTVNDLFLMNDHHPRVGFLFYNLFFLLASQIELPAVVEAHIIQQLKMSRLCGARILNIEERIELR